MNKALLSWIVIVINIALATDAEALGDKEVQVAVVRSDAKAKTVSESARQTAVRSADIDTIKKLAGQLANWKNIVTSKTSWVEWTAALASVKTERSSWAKAVARALPGWEIIQCDQQPTVSVDSHKGHRLLLRISHKKYLDPPQRPLPPDHPTMKKLKFVIKYSHVDLVLFPLDEDLSVDIKENIPWDDVEQQHFVKPVNMGQGMGFTWFGRTAISLQEDLRQKLGLKGGDDRLQLLTEGLGIVDGTASAAAEHLARFGEKAIPYIQDALRKYDGKYPEYGYAISALAQMPGKQSTEILRSLYASDKTRGSAALALIYQPYRKAAKKEYLDMVRRQQYLLEAAEACVEFQWKEAIPILQKICDEPSPWDRFSAAFKAKRELQGQPIPRDVEEAGQFLRKLVYYLRTPPSQESIQRAKKTILDSADREAATVIATNLAIFDAKAPSNRIKAVNEVGWEILRTLPEETVRNVLEHVIQGFREEYQQSARQKFRNLLDSRNAPRPVPPKQLAEAEMDKKNFRIELYDKDVIKPGLLPIGLYVTNESLGSKGIYIQAIKGQIPRGHYQLVGRMGGQYSRDDEIEVTEYKREGNRIIAHIRYIRAKPEGNYKKVAYLLADIPQNLPPGRYNVTITLAEYLRKGDNIIFAPKTAIHAFEQLTCTFEVPALHTAQPAQARLDETWVTYVDAKRHFRFPQETFGAGTKNRDAESEHSGTESISNRRWQDYPRKSAEEKAKWCGGVHVTIETEEYLLAMPPKKIRLVFHVQRIRNYDPVMFFATGRITAGAGLVIKHIGTDGTKTEQVLPYKLWWHSKGKFMQITSPRPPEGFSFIEAGHRLPSTYFEIWVGPLYQFDFSKRGIYQISYVHPWSDIKNTNMKFSSNVITIGIVSPARFDYLNLMLQQNPELALASYKFKHPPLSELPAVARLRYLAVLDEAIKKGTKWDQVLLLLGSPDILGYNKSEYFDWNEEWHYEMGPVSSYNIFFKDGYVVDKVKSVDDANP
ncbi:MAG: hypothetical protein GY845_29100 [Planctomycetes bacterium]|nr:hypothetical protein [Planctomycetota bacterium]